MAEQNILHMLTPLKHVSPFDANMALDAGYDSVVPYTSVALGEVTMLVQDAIFSRPPNRGARTAIFIGGKDAILALDMLGAAKAALVPPFQISLFADPAGSFTTAAAMMAGMEMILKTKFSRGLRDIKLFVFGATGVVGFSASVIAALEGARVTLIGYDGVQRVANSAAQIKSRFGVEVQFADGSTEERKAELAKQAEAIVCAGRAGVRVLTTAQIEPAGSLLVVADANAVPPSGVEGLAASANGAPIGASAALGLGPFALGNTKYKTEFELFRRMTTASKAVSFDFRDAFALAREIHA